jgi:PadR family transcriptional regulator, regulatory protein PadR
MAPKSTVELLQGTLDVLVLKTLSWGPQHGYGMARWIQQVTHDALQLEEGTLYPALYRLENKRLIESQWGTTENNRKAKYYRITPAGKKQLLAETAAWERLVLVVGQVLAAPRPQAT